LVLGFIAFNVLYLGLLLRIVFIAGAKHVQPEYMRILCCSYNIFFSCSGKCLRYYWACTGYWYYVTINELWWFIINYHF
jgi:hypothetical protein